VAFTIYFCFLHSIRHSITLAVELDPNNITNGFGLFIKKALPLTILTGVFSFIALYLLSNSYDLDSAILKLIFIGLASLTFPHILLEYFLEKNEK
jgi:Brp/Blh family beta-carotene 15,15'-monooxygenase